MNIRFFCLFTLAVASLICVRETCAQTSVSSNPVGYVQLTCTGASDTTVAVPFQQPAAFVGTISAVSGNSITVADTTGWAANQFVYSGSGSSTYYALLGAGTSGTNPKEGCYYTVTSNGTNTLAVALNGDSISSVPTGSYVSVIPYWTLGTVFPPSMSGTSFVATTSPLFPQTEIFMPNYSGSGTNLAAESTFFFYQGIWCLSGTTITTSYNDTILIPDGYITVRNPAGSPTTLTTMGTVLTGKITVPLASEPSASQDNYVSICRPVATSLNSLGLAPSTAFVTTSNVLFTQDLLFLSGSSAGINQAAGATYFYYVGTSGTGWRLVGDSLANDHGSDAINPGAGFVIRKVATGNGNTAFWQNAPTY